MPEQTVEPAGEEDLTEAITRALTEWMNTAVITAAVRWPGQGAWRRLVEERVLPVSERIYREAVAVVDGTRLQDFLDGVRTRLVDDSTLIDDIKKAQQTYGDDAVDIDWTGATGDALPWRARTSALGLNEAQQASGTAAVDSAPDTAMKEWRTQGDDRVRDTHRAANRQRRPINDPFTVGGESLMYPGDTRGTPGETMNCRCHMILVTPSEGESVNASNLTAAANHTGAMIALVPTQEDAERLTLPEGEPTDELHCTLYFLGEASNWNEEQRATLINRMADAAARLNGPVQAHAFGVNNWNPQSDEPVWVWPVSDHGGTPLERARAAARTALADGPSIPEQHSPWVAHVTGAYKDDDTPRDPMAERIGPVSFDRIRIAFGGENTDIPIGSGSTAMDAQISASVTLDTDADWAPRDTPWDGADAVARLREWATGDNGQIDEDQLARGYLWRTDGPPSDWKLPVATITDGELRLVFRGVTAAAAAVQGARTPIDLPAEDVDRIKNAISGLYREAADEFDDDTIIAPWDRTAAVTASLKQIAAAGDADTARAVLEAARSTVIAAAIVERGGAWRPEASWFQPPTPDDKRAMAQGEQPLVSDNGRILGYVATFRQPDGSPTLHLGYLDAGEYVPVPGSQDYGYFQQRNINYPLSDGTAAHVGIITDHGHPSDADNPQHQAALVRVGEDETGVWIAGAVFPDVLADQMRFSRMKASAISGEWDINSNQFRGASMVNHPGFPQPTTANNDFYALAASLGSDGTPEKTTDIVNAIERIVATRPEHWNAWLEWVAAASTTGNSDTAPEEAQEEAEGTEGIELPDNGDDPNDAPDYPEDVDRELVDAALDILKNTPAKELAASAKNMINANVALPNCLQILADHLEGIGTESQQSRAAAIKAAERICRSQDVENPTVRARACRLISEYRVAKEKKESAK